LLREVGLRVITDRFSRNDNLHWCTNGEQFGAASCRLDCDFAHFYNPGARGNVHLRFLQFLRFPLPPPPEARAAAFSFRVCPRSRANFWCIVPGFP